MADTITFHVTIEVPRSELARVEASVTDLAEGIHARLFPVASCHPDEVVASNVTVRHDEETQTVLLDGGYGPGGYWSAEDQPE